MISLLKYLTISFIVLVIFYIKIFGLQVHSMNCTLCSKIAQDFDGLIRHLRTTHVHENNFLIQCNFNNNCSLFFKNISSFKTHIIINVSYITRVTLRGDITKN